MSAGWEKGTSATFSDDSSLVALGHEDGRTTIMGTRDANWFALVAENGPITAAAFSPDGKCSWL
jgi:hypothetical protein